MTEDAPIVRGSSARYACRSVAEIDAHLKGITEWLGRELPAMHEGKRRAALRKYNYDIDKLLVARVMVAAFETMDADLDALGADDCGSVR
jgi:hypothetical protein